MKNLSYMLALVGALHLLTVLSANAQKKVSELSLIYDYSAGAAGPGGQGGSNEFAVHAVYIKGNKSRSEMTSPLFSSTILFDANTGFAVILKEVSGQKLLIRLNPENWTERSRAYDGLVFKNTTETKEIAGYKCIKAVGQTKSGITLTVFYTKELIPENKDYDPAFKTLEGLPLEYELTNGDIKIRYRINKINLNPVPASKFDIPKTGYREMNYEESKKLNIGG
ncbi:MAG TPA: hypothetical protein VL832_13160 [Puia sp.]|nr:hypothetical protein [Puia sp.]